jgi:hypothetical protein
MNPLVYVVAIVVLVAAGAAGGWKACSDHRDALELAEAKSKSDALTAMAHEIAKIDVRNVTIRQKTETQVREVPVYRDCKNTPEVMKTINEALSWGVK